MSKTYLSNVDLAWLRMDNPRNLMIITGLITLDTPIDRVRLQALTAGSLLKFDRFRQRVVLPRSPFQRPYWEEDSDLDLDAHIQTARLLPPGGQAELQDFVSGLMSAPLDPNRPLWKFYLFEKYGQGSALVARLHHAIADGIALMHVLLSMGSNDPHAPLPPILWRRQRPRVTDIPLPDPPAGEAEAEHLLTGRVDRAVELTAHLAGRVSREALHILTDSTYARQQARLGASAALAFGRLALRWPDPPTIFKGRLSPEKRAAWSAPLPLATVKRVSKMLQATINDILLAAVSGALSRYLRMRGRSTDDLNIRSLIPVNLRPLDLASELGNRFGLVFLSLPLGLTDPLERLSELKRRMDELKSTPEAAVALGVLNVMGAVPEAVQDIGVQIFDMKGSAVMTNVAGPRQQLYLAGAPIQTVMAWVPQSGRVSLGVSILSYHGKVFLGIATDRSLVPDPERIVGFFNEEFNAFQELARRLPALRKDYADLLAALDRANQSLDEVIAQKAENPAGSHHCQALTRRGQPCRNQALKGSAYCKTHQGIP